MILILEIMGISDIKKPGRPRGPRKVAFYRMVEEDKLGLLKECYERLRDGVSGEELVKEVDAAMGRLLDARATGAKEAIPAPVADDVPVGHTKALLDDIERLTFAVAKAEAERGEALSLDQDGRVAYWKGELAKFKEEVRNRGDFSQ